VRREGWKAMVSLSPRETAMVGRFFVGFCEEIKEELSAN
jgi:hypothetical protein